MPSILIIGKNSFIGNNFIRFSQNKKIRVESLLDTDPKSIDFSGIDVVLHLAAIVHVSNKYKPSEYYRVNRDLTVEIAKYAKAAGVRQFIFMSTIKVYGGFEEGSHPWNENSDCNPADNYAKSKFEAETLIKNLSESGFCVSILRIPVVYGYGMKANMLNLMKLVKYSPLLPLGGIDNKRHYIYIQNLAGFIDRLILVRAPGIYIAMDRDAVSTTELIKLLAGAMHKKLLLFKLPDGMVRLARAMFPDQINRLYGSFKLDNSVTLSKLDYKPAFSTGEGILKMIGD